MWRAPTSLRQLFLAQSQNKNKKSRTWKKRFLGVPLTCWQLCLVCLGGGISAGEWENRKARNRRNWAERRRTWERSCEKRLGKILRETVWKDCARNVWVSHFAKTESHGVVTISRVCDFSTLQLFQQTQSNRLIYNDIINLQKRGWYFTTHHIKK